MTWVQRGDDEKQKDPGEDRTGQGVRDGGGSGRDEIKPYGKSANPSLTAKSPCMHSGFYF